MIFDNIKNRKNYGIDSDLAKILDRMYAASVLPESRIEISETAFINPVKFISKPESEVSLYESHIKYADVHFILEGSEKITVIDIDKLKRYTEYDESTDFQQHEGSGGTDFILNEGDFLVCFPGEAHKVAVAPEKSEEILKLVGKIKC